MIYNGKSRIEDEYGRLSISIPSKKNWPILLFSLLWLFGWYFGFNSAFKDLNFGHNKSEGIDGFLLIWLTGWTLGGLYIIFLSLWGFFGRETIIIESGVFSLKKSIFNIGINRQLDTRQIKNIRLERIETGIFNRNQKSIWGLGPGKIKLDYGLKTYSFGLGIDDAEATYIIELLTKKLT
jgi:hypothetical protein